MNSSHSLLEFVFAAMDVDTGEQNMTRPAESSIRPDLSASSAGLEKSVSERDTPVERSAQVTEMTTVQDLIDQLPPVPGEQTTKFSESTAVADSAVEIAPEGFLIDDPEPTHLAQNREPIGLDSAVDSPVDFPGVGAPESSNSRLEIHVSGKIESSTTESGDVSVSVASRAGHRRCVYCHEKIKFAPLACPGCRVAVHRECWSEFGGCPTAGCEGNPFIVEIRNPGRQISPGKLKFVIAVCSLAFFITFGVAILYFGQR